MAKKTKAVAKKTTAKSASKPVAKPKRVAKPDANVGGLSRHSATVKRAGGPTELKGKSQGAVAKAAVVKRPDSMLRNLLAEGERRSAKGPLGLTAYEQNDDGTISRKQSSLAPHGLVKAGPGTGKTFTMIMGVAFMFGDRTLPAGMGVGAGKSLWYLVRHMLGFMPSPSEEQKDIWEFMQKGEKPHTIRYMAFNNTIVDEFESKYGWLIDALKSIGVDFSFSTIHSLGYQTVKAKYGGGGKRWVNDWKTKDYLSEIWGRDLNELWKEKGDTIDAVVKLVKLCKLTLAGILESNGEAVGVNEMDLQELDDLCTRYDVELNGNREEVYELVNKVLVKGREPGQVKQRIDFADMIWLPVVNDLQPEQYDLLICDEWQDACRASQEIALKAGRRIICVGDERQAIYGFAGADSDSMERMRDLLAYKEGDRVWAKPEKDSGATSLGELAGCPSMLTFPLTETRRCGKAIVAEALRRVNELPHSKGVACLSAHADNSLGEICTMPYAAAYGGQQCAENPPCSSRMDWRCADCSAREAGYQPGDFVLCRCNAPLVSLAFQLLRDKRPVQIQGRPIGADFKRLIKKSKCSDLVDFVGWLEKYEGETLAKMAKRKQRDEEAEVALQDKCECLRAICLEAEDMRQLYAHIKQIDDCFNNAKEGEGAVDDGDSRSKSRVILLSSIHRAKGLESKRVFLLRPDLLPHKMAKSVTAKEQESNLLWVGITRAIETFVYVTGKRALGGVTVADNEEELGEMLGD